MSKDLVDSMFRSGQLGFKPYDPEVGMPAEPAMSDAWRTYEDQVTAAVNEANARQADLPADAAPVEVAQVEPPKEALGDIAELADAPNNGCLLEQPDHYYNPALDQAIASDGASIASSPCGPGNFDCYHSMRVETPPLPTTADSNQIEYMVYIAAPQANETNQCDGQASPGCFWFQGANIDFRNLDGTLNGCALHFGPIRGAQQLSSWRFNYGYYCNGIAYPYSNQTVSFYHNTWYRIRMTRASYWTWSGAVFSTWNLYYTGAGSEQPLGTVDVPGKDFNGVILYSELSEEDGPCSTDLQSVHFDEIKSRLNTTVLRQGSGSVGVYEATCLNTSIIDQDTTDQTNQHFSFVRDTTRVTGTGYQIWSGAK